MIDMPTAARVTVNCIRLTADLFPPEDFPVDSKSTLISLGIDNTRIDLLRKHIAGSPKFGLPSLVPKRKIDIEFLDISETSTVFDVFDIVRKDTVLA